MKQKGKAIIWPANLDLRKTRKEGRKIPKSIALDMPKLHEIEAAARDLNLNPIPVKEASRPSTWWEKTGYVIVDKKGESKISILRKIASNISSKRKVL
ncbi:MAG: signal recognition particle subunit SRP19/SEC65 family protein [Candidatus Bathyarchaeia archaeon]